MRTMKKQTIEDLRLEEGKDLPVPSYKKWGPYVSERAWGTVREDYSWNGDAWRYFPFEEAHKKVYRWGEDGIAGWCDRYQVLTFAPAFWNGKDPILKERLFGLSSPEGNHGEDVKECYYYLDGTPSHSYMKYLYKYPQNEFPYKQLKEENQRRGSHDPEFELVDTGVFADNRYFDIFIEYAKNNAEDICIRIEACNRSNDSAPLHLLPQIWFRNQWAWGDVRKNEPVITEELTGNETLCLVADDSELASPASLDVDYHLGKRYCYASSGGTLLFTNNEDLTTSKGFQKDAFNRYIIHNESTINTEKKGTKAGFHYVFDAIAGNSSVVIYLRLTDRPLASPFHEIAQIFADRKAEADAFFDTIYPPLATEDERLIQRQAIAGMLWAKQFYYFDVNLWLEGDKAEAPPPENRKYIRNQHWRHVNSMRILSMPDKWEYPWFAAWDLGFHCLTLGLVDIEFAKEQLWLLLFEQFQHPNGAIPAYEWEFSDLNPPVQAWAALSIYKMQKERSGVKDLTFLKKCFFKLLINFAYWVNKVDSSGCNVFEGGFLGLDNITLIDRSKENNMDAMLKQSDGTGWMAKFSLNMMRIALELSSADGSYEFLATKFFQHFVYIADAMKKMGNKKYSMWNEEDQFFYDVLVYPDGNVSQFRIRSLVGLIPLFAVDVLSEAELDSFPEFKKNFHWFLKNRQRLTDECALPVMKDGKRHYLLTLVSENHLKSVLKYLWDPNEFRSTYGFRSLSKIHEKQVFHYKDMHVGYEPGESMTRLKGGNSNWRGPIWFPTSYLILQSLKTYAEVFHFQTQVGEEPGVDLHQMTQSFADRMIALFAKDPSGLRPFFGAAFPFSKDPHFQNHILFNEFFHGDTGLGLGASHQTGWTGLVANIIDEFRRQR
ncbi:MAG: glucosidase [Rhabdochlamydiaceae bacterium]|nr:glucosidase [Rhabdochlamydiaceae bacterium]